MADQSGKSTYYPVLDGLRGVAVLMVVYGHAGYNGWVPLVVGCATTGVVLFFFLSGFLMASRYLPKVSPTTLWRDSPGYWLWFVLRRFMRVFPPYVFAPIVGYLLLMPRLPPDFAWQVGLTDPALIAKLGDFVSLQGVLGIYWTIKIELFFYALYPFLIAAFVIVGRRAWPLAAIFLWLAVLNHFRHGVGGIAWDVPLFSDWGGYVAIFVAGVFTVVMSGRFPAERLTRSQWNITAAASLACFFMAVLVLAQFKPTQLQSWQKEWLFAPLLFVLFTSLRHADGVVSRVLASRAAVMLGQVSYSLYLVHVIAFNIVVHRLPGALQGAPAAIVACALLTAIYFVIVERPFVRLSKRIPVHAPEGEPERAEGGAVELAAAP